MPDFFQIYTDPAHLIQYGGIILLLTIIYLETGVFLGLVLPGGDYLIFTAGVLCGTGYLDLNIILLIFLMISAAFAGDFTGFVKGKWLGNRFLKKEDSAFFKRSYLIRTRTIYLKYGALGFILGKFIPFVRTLIPMLAGASQVPSGKFALFNITAATIWIGTLTPLGYFLGTSYPDLMKHSIWILLGFIVLASFPLLKIIFPFRKEVPGSDQKVK